MIFFLRKKNVTRCATWSPFGPFCICSSYEKTLSVSILLKPLPPQAKIASEMKVLLISVANFRIAILRYTKPSASTMDSMSSVLRRRQKSLWPDVEHTERIDFNSTTAAFRLYMLLSQKMKTFPFFSKINATISYVVESCLFLLSWFVISLYMRKSTMCCNA